MQNMKKVILIGGSPMVGKTTAAVSLAAKLAYQCISTDDIGEVLQTIADINPMRGQNYLDYYSDNEKSKLIDDIINYHKILEPAINRLIEIHSAWGRGKPMIMEGWALYPNNLKNTNENVFTIWLVADKNLLRTRFIANESFYKNARDPEKVIENYVFRSEWHNNLILEQCKANNQVYILVKEDSSTDEIVASILKLLTE